MKCTNSSLSLFLILLLSISLHFPANASTDSLMIDNKLIYADSAKISELTKNKTDRELANIYNATGIHYDKNKQSKVAVTFYKKALNLYSSQNSLKEKALCYKNMASAYFEIGRYEKAGNAFKRAIFIQESLKDSLNLSHSLLDISYFYINTHRYQDALHYLKKAADFSKEKYITELPHIYYLSGSVYHDNGNLDSAFLFYFKTLDVELLLNNENEVISSFNNIGVLYYKADSLDKAFDHFNEALDYAVKHSNKKLIAIQHNNLGNIYLSQKSYEQAEKSYKKSIIIKQNNKNNEGVAISMLNMAQLYLEQNKLKLAKENCTTAIKGSMKTSTIGIANLILSKIYKLEGQHETALKHLKQYAKSKSAIIESSAHAPISELKEKYINTKTQVDLFRRELEMQELLRKYDIAIKEETIRLLENTNLQAKRQNNRFFITSIIIFIFIAVIVFFTLQKRRANKRLEKRNDEIEEQNIIIIQQKEDIQLHNKELEKLSIVAEKTDNAVIIMDADGNFEWVNKAYESLFGHTVKHLIENISPNIIGPATSEEVKEKINFAKENKETISYEMKAKNKAGEDIWVNATLTPILDENGEISRLVVIDTDITSIKEAEQEILQQKGEIELQRNEIEGQRDEILLQSKEIEAQKEQLASTLKKLQLAQEKLVESEKMASLGSLVAGVAHEVNTPVGIGIATSSTLVEKTVNFTKKFKAQEMTVESLKKYLEGLYQSCKILLSNLNRTSELVQSFKQVSVDNMTEQKRDFNMYAYLEDIIRSMRPKFKNRPVEVTTNCDKNLSIKSFPGAFAQIFTNFINNSLLHGFDESDEGKITLDIKAVDNNLVCLYKDNGKGIPEENIKKVFDPFFTTNMQHGTGLGMNITYNLVNQKLGGDMTLESGAGKGVTFTITIPIENLS